MRDRIYDTEADLYCAAREQDAPAWGVYKRRARYGANFNLFRPVRSFNSRPEAIEFALAVGRSAERGKPYDVAVQAGRSHADLLAPYEA